jgi:DNA-binding MarR family transcriptional regulator
MAERLANKGLIERRPSAQDGRVILAFLTPAGRQAGRRCLATVKTHNAAIKEGFSTAEIRGFSRILEAIIKRFTEE